MRMRRNPAVFAGLVGGTSLALPATARAASLEVIIQETFSNPAAAFAAGLAGGAALATLAGMAIVHARSKRAGETTGEPPEDRPSRPPRHMRSPEPEDTKASQPVEAAGQQREGRHAATSYEQIAENYAARATFKRRMAQRAQGVAATLRERMGQTMMDGVPVIARADGSVGDVGTSWWKSAVGEDAIIADSGFAEEGEGLAIPSDFTTNEWVRLASSARHADRGISSRVAFVDEGAYPERRTAEDLDSEDIWESALKSLDEKIAAVAPSQDPIGFIDSVGDADSLEEPDNLEPQTAFLHFKTPGGHPEVVDTETYVDYLIEDEFSKNSSNAVRRTSRRFLRILEGGTQQTSRHLAGSEPSEPSYVGRHFAAPLAAQA